MANLGEANIGGRMVPAWLLNLTAEELDSLKSRWYNNPNLLDNWYFGNPVDQLGGYVVPPNKPYYQDNYSTQIGTTDRYYTLNIAGYNSGRPYGTINVNGVTGYIGDMGGAVRGYTGARYGIDRWKINQPVLTILDDSIKLTSSGDYRNFLQVVDNAKLLAGKTVTLSFLYKSTVSTSYCQFNINGTWTSYLQFVKSAEWKLEKLTYTFGSDLTSLIIGISIMTNGDIELQAAKLELGETQTLAHQDSSGKWQLNELPNYADTLARCQRYQFGVNPKRYGRPAIGVSTSQSSGAFVLSLPVTMREIPTVTFRGLQVFYLGNNYNVTSINVSGLTDNAVLLDITFDASIPNGVALILVANEGSELLFNANL